MKSVSYLQFGHNRKPSIKPNKVVLSETAVHIKGFVICLLNCIKAVIPKVGVHVPLNYTKFGTMVFTKWFLGNFN